MDWFEFESKCLDCGVCWTSGVDGKLFITIQRLVAEEKYVVGEHASERLEERGIMEWQAVVALADGELVAEKPTSKPNPTVEVREYLPDGTEFKAVWSHLRQSGVAKLVTVHFLTEVSHEDFGRTTQKNAAHPNREVRRGR